MELNKRNGKGWKEGRKEKGKKRMRGMAKVVASLYSLGRVGRILESPSACCSIQQTKKRKKGQRQRWKRRVQRSYALAALLSVPLAHESVVGKSLLFRDTGQMQ